MGITIVDSTPLKQSQFDHAIRYLGDFPGMDQLLIATITRDLKVEFVEGIHSSMKGDTVFWNPTDAFNVITYNDFVRAESPALGLLHELYHWYMGHGPGDPKWDEYDATQFENRAATFLDEPVRLTYQSYYVAHPFTTVTNPTAKAPHGFWQAVDPNGNRINGDVYDKDAPGVVVIGTGSGSGGAGGSGGTGGGTESPGSGGGAGSSGDVTLPDYVPGSGGKKGGGWWQKPQSTEPVEQMESSHAAKFVNADVPSGDDPYGGMSDAFDTAVSIVGVVPHHVEIM